jgi:hypothetical protein
MPNFNFPSNPSIGDSVFIGLYKYTWSGDTWDRILVDVDSLSSDIIDQLTGAAPEALNTLEELAAALGDDANFATTVTNAIAAKATTATYTCTILAADTWTDTSGIFTLAKTVNGMLSTDNPVADLKLDNTTDPLVNVPLIQTAWATVYRIQTSTNGVTFYATALPVFPEDTPVQFKVVR